MILAELEFQLIFSSIVLGLFQETEMCFPLLQPIDIELYLQQKLLLSQKKICGFLIPI